MQKDFVKNLETRKALNILLGNTLLLGCGTSTINVNKVAGGNPSAILSKIKYGRGGLELMLVLSSKI